MRYHQIDRPFIKTHLKSMGARATYLPQATVKQIAQQSDLWGAWLVFHVWAVVFGAMALFILFPNQLTFVLAFLVIGSRQHGMAILMHDAAHGVLFKTKPLNEFAGRYLLAAPYGGDMESYRHYHLKHHRFTQSKDDPDLPLSAKFPTDKSSLRRKFIRDLTGQTFFRLKMAARNLKKGEAPGIEGSDAFQRTSPWPFMITNLILFFGLALTGYWWVYFVLWLAPLFTWFFFVLRLRNIAEHAMTTHDDNPLTHARTTQINWFERVFFGPYWVNYHVEHHAYMFVPCYRLKELHKEMSGYHDQMEIRRGYREVLRAATL